MFNIKFAETAEVIERCFPVMQELRAHLKEDQFVSRVNQQREAYGYRLIYLEEEGDIVAVAGYRVFENLAWGRTLYVDDFVTAKEFRRQGHGDQLMEWLIAEARRQQCAQLHLDSAVQRHAAHRLYMSRGLNITSHHFSISLSD
ncbi:MAG: GNAT family N-acetyltransferase [Candidatus Hydrogenedentes bacterium]|nr:GNAT family N-acetyltransferase [Candidatus Hydrogenedentota bacterium]